MTEPRTFAIMDSRAIDDVDRAAVMEICETAAEAKREAPKHGDGCCVFEMFEGRPPAFVWQHGTSADGWRTARQMAKAWGTRTRLIIGYTSKLGVNDSAAHVRGEGPAREYSPDVQALIEREWRSYGRPR